MDEKRMPAPWFGARAARDGTRFRVWAPGHSSVDVRVQTGEGAGSHPLRGEDDGWFSGTVARVGPGDRYRYRLDGREQVPDPASRHQPDGVHGPSAVVAPERFVWQSVGWRGARLEGSVLYELHVGTFTPEGTFDAIVPRLDAIRALGVTAIELMPVAEFAGARNWGYDGVYPYAPESSYGGPEGLQRLIDAAHARELAVVLDVVYNHLGPEGNCLPAVTSGAIFTDRHQTPWGQALNFDDVGSGPVREFFLQNALYWLQDYRVDGLRLDATHAIADDSTPHFLQELAARVREAVPRPVLLIAEDSRNERRLLLPLESGGCGMDAVWSDDLHHQIRRLTAGDDEGYFRPFRGTVPDLVTTLRKGWFFDGGEPGDPPRGTSAEGLAPEAFVHFIQNHDQVGNRALGERLHHDIPLPVFRALSALLLLSPYTPLLWMGQEWAASTPFLYFTDHPEELGRRVTEGRRGEFRDFSAFRDSEARARIPDPQSESTFLRSKLRWEERGEAPHLGVLALYEALLALRRELPALVGVQARERFAVTELGDDGLALRRDDASGGAVLLLVALRGPLTVDLAGRAETQPPAGRSWRLVLATEEDRFGGAGGWGGRDGDCVELASPGAVVFHA